MTVDMRGFLILFSEYTKFLIHLFEGISYISNCMQNKILMIKTKQEIFSYQCLYDPLVSQFYKLPWKHTVEYYSDFKVKEILLVDSLDEPGGLYAG